MSLLFLLAVMAASLLLSYTPMVAAWQSTLLTCAMGLCLLLAALRFVIDCKLALRAGDK